MQVWSTLARRLLQPDKLFRVASILITLTWPLLIWLALHYQFINWLLPVIALVLVLRLLLAGKNVTPLRTLAQSVALTALLLCLASVLLRQYQLLLYYPVVVNLIMLTLFATSLFSGMPLIERLARWRDPSLPPEAVHYTRRVTQIWCLFFSINGSIALITCLLGDMALWALWNGLLSYLCTGSLMAGEWLVRQRLIRRMTL